MYEIKKLIKRGEYKGQIQIWRFAYKWQNKNIFYFKESVRLLAGFITLGVESSSGFM
jgi:hypothetical protein